MKITPRSSNIMIIAVFLAVLVGTGYSLTMAFQKHNGMQNSISRQKTEQRSQDERSKGLKKDVDEAKAKFSDAKVFMDRVSIYQLVSGTLEQGAGFKTRQLAEQLAQSNRVTPQDWITLPDTTRVVGDATYIGRSYRLSVLGEFRNIGKLLADLENTIPLLRVTNLRIAKDNEPGSNAQSTTVGASITFIVISNIEGPKTDADQGPRLRTPVALPTAGFNRK